jgi:phosphoglycolate phosphatase-like HAD superfamily hydrolase
VYLALFDIDGTLVRSKQVDQDCFVRAFEEVTGARGVEGATDHYRYSTDSGICQEAFREYLGREPGEGEAERVEARFVELLAEVAEREPSAFTEVPGASEALRRLRDDPGWCMAIATGCWRASAELKLARARIDSSGLPLATSDGCFPREGVMREAVRLAAEACGPGAGDGFERTVYVGDGPWDARAAAAMGAGFVGIHDTRDPAPLREAGATSVLRDYADFEAFARELARAPVPARSGGPGK